MDAVEACFFIHIAFWGLAPGHMACLHLAIAKVCAFVFFVFNFILIYVCFTLIALC